MFQYEPSLNPPYNEWKEYTLPTLCAERMRQVCFDIVKKGEKTFYQEIYDAIYELVEADIETENLEADYD